MVFMSEYKWIMDEKELEQLKRAKPGEEIYCQDQMLFESDKQEIDFSIGVQRIGIGGSYAGFSLRINKTMQKKVSGYFALIVDELKYTIHEWRFSHLGPRDSEAIPTYDSNLADTLKSFTLRIALYFY